MNMQTAFSATDAPKPKPKAGAAPPENCPLQLVSTGNAADDYSFKLCEDNLDRVLSKVTEFVGGGVVIVAVVVASFPASFSMSAPLLPSLLPPQSSTPVTGRSGWCLCAGCLRCSDASRGRSKASPWEEGAEQLTTTF